MNSLALMAINMLQNRPDISSNPLAKEMIEVIRTGDNAKGEQIARNLCQSHGESVQDVSNKAKQFFNIK